MHAHQDQEALQAKEVLMVSQAMLALLVYPDCLATIHQSPWMPLENASGAHLDLMAHPAQLALPVLLDPKEALVLPAALAKMDHLAPTDPLALLATKPKMAKMDHPETVVPMPRQAKRATMDPLDPGENLEQLEAMATKAMLANLATLVLLVPLVHLAAMANLATKEHLAQLVEKDNLAQTPNIVLALAEAIKHQQKTIGLGEEFNFQKFLQCSSMLFYICIFIPSLRFV